MNRCSQCGKVHRTSTDPCYFCRIGWKPVDTREEAVEAYKQDGAESRKVWLP